VHSGSCKTAQHHGGVMAYGVFSDKNLALTPIPLPVTAVVPMNILTKVKR